MEQLPEERLIGWLCFFALQHSHDGFVCMPRAVRQQLADRGWLIVEGVPEDEKDEGGRWQGGLTEAGAMVVDLNAPEWGMASLPEESSP